MTDRPKRVPRPWDDPRSPFDDGNERIAADFRRRRYDQWLLENGREPKTPGATLDKPISSWRMVWALVVLVAIGAALFPFLAYIATGLALLYLLVVVSFGLLVAFGFVVTAFKGFDH